MNIYYKNNNVIILLIIFLSIFTLAGCSGNSFKDNIDDSQDFGYIDGYVYATSEGDYTLTKGEDTIPIEGAIIKIQGNIYETNHNGYFKSSKLMSGFEYGVSIIVKNKNDTDFAWSNKVKVQKDQTSSINRLSIEKNWNVVMFISDKSTSLDTSVQYFLSSIESNDPMKNLNLFIIHGKVTTDFENDTIAETNKGYYVTENGMEQIKDYGVQSFADPSFYREELQRINEKYPAKKTMVTIQAHGSGWEFTGEPGELQNWLAADTALAERLQNSDDPNVRNDFALDSFDLYDVFSNIGFEIDIFSMAACHMGQIEVLNDLPQNINYVLASPSYGYTSDMYIHTDIMDEINNGELDAGRLAKKYVDYYVESLDSNDRGSYASVKSVYKLDRISEFTTIFKDLSNELLTLFNNEPDKVTVFQDHIMRSHENIQTYFHYTTRHDDAHQKDVIGMVEYLRDNPDIYGEAISSKAEDAALILKDIVYYTDYSKGYDSAVYYEDKDPNQEKFTYKKSNGLSISVVDFNYYKNLWFNQKTDWFKIVEKIDVYFDSIDYDMKN